GRVECRASEGLRRSRAWLVSIMLHGLVFFMLISVGTLEPTLPSLEVFTTEPERDAAALTPIARQARSGGRPKPRPAGLASSRPSSIQPAPPKAAAEPAISSSDRLAREYTSDERPQRADSAGDGREPVASALVPPLTLTPAKTLTAIESPSEAEPTGDDALAAKALQPSDKSVETAAVTAESAPAVSGGAAARPSVDGLAPDFAMAAPERQNAAPHRSPPPEPPTPPPSAIPDGPPPPSASRTNITAQATPAQTTNERSVGPTPDATGRAASRTSGSNAPIGVVI